MIGRALAWAAAALSMLIAPAAQGAGGPALVPYTLEVRGGRLRASLDLSSAFSADLSRQLTNGLTNVVVIHVALTPEPSGEPAAAFSREVDVLYDVWEESYRVTQRDLFVDRPRAERLVLGDSAALRDHLLKLRDLDLGPAAAVADGRWFFQIQVEVNPVSDELLERAREFIANPPAGSREGGSSRSILGAMASYLLRNADPGSDVHRYRTMSFTLREVPVR